MLDELLISLKNVSILLLPFLGVVVLVYLILILKKLLSALGKIEHVITNVDDKITKLEAPLNTVNQLSHTIDGVHEASIHGVNSAIDFLVKNMGTITAWFKELINAHNQEQKGDE